jgi:hypothetical protein
MHLWVEPDGGERKSANIERKTVTLIYPYPSNQVFHYIPTHADQDLEVKCISLQKRTDGRNIFPPRVITQPFDLVFGPLPNPAQVAKFYVKEPII